MSPTLKVSNELSLPIDAITQTFGIVAQRGSGKTYLTAVVCEEFDSVGLPFVVMDPMGVYYGLRCSADGKREGLPVIILGGEHGDVPLESTSGRVIADWVVAERRSAVLDLSLFGKNEQRRFVTDFAEQLYHRNRDPLHLILDEADMWAPQKPKGVERMLGAIEDLVRRGRARGIGLSLVTQRPAVLNKDVLTQVSVLIALRVTGPQDRDAVEAWIKYHGEKTDRDEVLSSLASLPIGTAWFWSPGWLGILKKVQIRKRHTFDSSATPKIGERVVTPQKLAPVDLDVLRDRIAATIEKAKAEDPKELRKQIAQLQKEKGELEKRLATPPSAEPIVERVEVPVLANGALTRIENLLTKAARVADSFPALEKVFKSECQKIAAEIGKVKPEPIAAAVRSTPYRPVRPLTFQKIDSTPVTQGAVGFIPSKTQQRILDALAWYESIGNGEPTTPQVGAIALIDATGGHFSNTIGPLSSQGLVVRGSGTLRLTDAGRALAVVPESVASLDDYHEVLRSRVRRARSAGGKTIEILNAIIAHRGEEVTTAEIGEKVGIDHTGGHFSNMIGPLGTIGLIERRSGVVRPTEILFPPGLD